MVTQPQFVIFVSCNVPLRSRNIHGYEYRFVLVRADQIFGLSQVWITKQHAVTVSDPERTIIDGLRQPKYVGGITEVVKALWMRRKDLNPDRLTEYALKLDNGAVIRRLGFLMEICDIKPETAIHELQSRLTSSYDLLYPTLPREGHFLARWRLRTNISATSFGQSNTPR